MKNKKKPSASKKRANLGRGFEELFGEDSQDNGQIQMVPVAKLRPGPFQPRQDMDMRKLDELESSIRQFGVLQPLLARPLKEEGHYEIIAGERRWRAAQRAQSFEVPVYVRDMDEKDGYITALAENIQRADLNPIEEAEGFANLCHHFKLTHEDIAHLIGRSRGFVSNRLRLLHCPKEIQQLVRSGEMSAAHARSLLTSKNPQEIAQKIGQEKLTVRQTEDLVRKRKGRHTRKKRMILSQEEARELLEHQLGLRVLMTPVAQKRSGELKIQYKNRDEFKKIVDFIEKLSRKGF